MAYLINRNPAARFDCLHSLVKFIYHFYGVNQDFYLKGVKYNPNLDNIHKYCTLLKISEFGDPYCPYLQNQLSEAGCNMTNGINCDSTKSKEVSNTVNALHALGFVKRTDRAIRLTNFGVEFANAKFGTKEMQDIIHNAVVRYGPAVGVLKQISDLCKPGGTFNTDSISVGYPDPNEMVQYERGFVILSAGSQDDSNTRTKSCILAWLTAGGYIRPTNLSAITNDEFAHSKYNEFLNQSHRNIRTYVYISEASFLKGKQFVTQSPLDYKNLTKMTGALRENNLTEVRNATRKYEPIIQNRRLAIVYLLNNAYNSGKDLNYNSLVDFFKNHIDQFVIDDTSLDTTLREEIRIADMVGIPYSCISKNGGLYLHPVCGVNTSELTIGAPAEVIDILKSTTL